MRPGFILHLKAKTIPYYTDTEQINKETWGECFSKSDQQRLYLEKAADINLIHKMHQKRCSLSLITLSDHCYVHKCPQQFILS